MISSFISALMITQAYPFLVFSGAIFVLTSINYIYMPKLAPSPLGPDKHLSILVPARNEEKNIEACLASLLRQDHPNYEVIVLDDGSTDRTGRIVERLMKDNPHLRLIAGEPLPDGWRGKNWACWQLSKAASGDVLLFTDADTMHAPDSGSCACTALERTGAGLVSGMVRQRMLSLGELMLVPVMNWAMMCFMPLPWAHKKGNILPPAACGQFMAFTRASYSLCGGHEAIRSKVLDDTELARAVKSAGMRPLLFDATAKVSCRMYIGLRDAVSGFTKNLFSVFRNRVLGHIFVWTWLLFSNMLPLLYILTANDRSYIVPASLSSVFTLAAWYLAFRKAKVPSLLAFAFPILMPLWFWLAMRSMLMVLSGRASWKGRNLGRGALKL